MKWIGLAVILFMAASLVAGTIRGYREFQEHEKNNAQMQKPDSIDKLANAVDRLADTQSRLIDHVDKLLEQSTEMSEQLGAQDVAKQKGEY